MKNIYATYANRHIMAYQALRKRYYRYSMERDCIEYFWKNHKCQIFTDKIDAPPAPFFNMVAP